MGWVSGSLALVAEAGHLASDGLALLLALLATWFARSPRWQGTWLGQQALEIWAALINGLALLGIAAWIGWEALARLQTAPESIASWPLLITAIAGIGVNSINIALLHRGSEQDLNLRAAFLHVLADGLSAIGVVVAAICITVWHWLWMDGVISLAIAVLITASTLPLVVQTIRALWFPIPAVGKAID